MACIVLKHGHGAFGRAAELVRRHSEAQDGCPVTYTYSFKERHELLRDFGLVDMGKAHIFPYLVPKYVRYQYQTVWYFRWMPTWLFRWLKRRLGWDTLVVARARP